MSFGCQTCWLSDSVTVHWLNFAVVRALVGRRRVWPCVAGGRVSAFERVTPTDHLTAPGGVLERSLASLGPDAETKAELLLAILDPCAPVTLESAGPEAP